MKLYSAPASPFARKVRAFIIEADLSDAVEITGTKGTPLDPGTHPVALNPLKKIPVLERDDGPALFDSRVITRFLNEHAGRDFYPEQRLWEVLTLEALADGIMEAGIAIVYEGRLRPDAQQSVDWMDAQWGKITSAIGAVNDRWMSHLEGRFDMGQLALACALGYIDFRLGDRDWRSSAPELAAWYERVKTRPSLAATVPHG